MKRVGKERIVWNPGQSQRDRIVLVARNRVVEEAEYAAEMEHPDLNRLSAALHDLWIAKLAVIAARSDKSWET